MSKAILILDVDEKTYNSNVTSISFENKETIFFMKDVKLKPLPQKMKADYDTITSCEVTEKVVAMGWNACISAILEGEEKE